MNNPPGFFHLGSLFYNSHVTKPADLLAYVFDAQPHLLSPDLLSWMDSSPRFTLFVETYRDKIRKKLRGLRDDESALDLRRELETAFRLLADRRLGVAYEPYASSTPIKTSGYLRKRRGPDFAVTYRAHTVFNVEVARIRSGIEPAHAGERILRILLDKLEQMQPAMPNLLVIHTPAEAAGAIDLDRWMQELKIKVEGKDPAFYAFSRYAGPPAFYRDFLRLSGILLWAPESQVWLNKQARPALDERILRLVSSLLSS